MNLLTEKFGVLFCAGKWLLANHSLALFEGHDLTRSNARNSFAFAVRPAHGQVTSLGFPQTKMKPGIALRNKGASAPDFVYLLSPAGNQGNASTDRIPARGLNFSPV